MGVQHSDDTKNYSCGPNACNCFAHDRNVREKSITRLRSANSSARTSGVQSWAQVVNETCITNELLLAKPLCLDWYQSHFAATPVFNVGLVCNDSRLVASLHSKLSDSSLPSLNPMPRASLPRVTCFVDSSMFTIKLTRVSEERSHHQSKDLDDEVPHVYVVLMTDKDRILDIHRKIEKHQSAGDIVVLARVNAQKTGPMDQGIAMKQFREQCNICCVDLSLDSEDSVEKFPLTLVKHYWFKKCACC